LLSPPLRLRRALTVVASLTTPARRRGIGLNVSAASCWCWTARRSGPGQSPARDWPKLLSDLPPPVPSWGPRGLAGSAASLRTLPSKACTTFGRREGRLASIPVPGYPVRAWEEPYVPCWPTGAGQCRGWSTRSSSMRAGVPGSCPLVPPSRPTRSATSNSDGRASRQFGADRHGDHCPLTRPLVFERTQSHVPQLAGHSGHAQRHIRSSATCYYVKTPETPDHAFESCSNGWPECRHAANTRGHASLDRAGPAPLRASCP
jgi:hypothetical protein